MSMPPSGLERLSCAAAKSPPAPVECCTTTARRIFSWSLADSMRATMSVEPPGRKGISKVTGSLASPSCANTPTCVAARLLAAANTKTLRFMNRVREKVTRASMRQPKYRMTPQYPVSSCWPTVTRAADRNSHQGHEASRLLTCCGVQPCRRGCSPRETVKPEPVEVRESQTSLNCWVEPVWSSISV